MTSKALGDFKDSAALSLGVELELQLVNLHDFDLVGSAPDLLRDIEKRKLKLDVKPEMTISMIESVYRSRTRICMNTKTFRLKRNCSL